MRLNRAERGRAVRFAMLGNVVPVAVALLTHASSHPPVFFVGAAGSCIAPMIVTAVGRRLRIIFYLAAFGGLPSLTLMQAHSGGVASGYSVLVMMAMVWFGLQATDRELLVGTVVLAACCYLPMLLAGPPAYPVDWGHATLLLLIGVSVAASLRAVTRETQRLTRRLRQEAVIDDLTGLLNRRGWTHAGTRELAKAGRTGQPLGLMLLDLDRLKQVNDTMGHSEGDRLLRETADRMRAAFRAGDVVARLGGDEFAALLSEVSPDELLEIAERLRLLTPPTASFSAAVAAWTRGETLEEFLHRADVALYAAKSSGRGRIELAPRRRDAPAEIVGPV